MSAPTISPTPVLDAVECAANDLRDQLWAGAFANLVADTRRVQILSLDDEMFSLGDADDEAFPEPGARIFNEEAWVECHTPIVEGGKDNVFGVDIGVRTGVLIERIWASARAKGDAWPLDLLSFRFAILSQGVPIICPCRVMVAPNVYLWHGINSPREASETIEGLDFPDFERTRFGLQPAATASGPDLLRMYGSVVDVGGRYIRAIPDGKVSVLYKNAPRYALATDMGVEALRYGLMAAYAENWLPADIEKVSPETANILRGLMPNVILSGPVIALRLLASLERPPIGEFVRASLPPEFARERTATRMSVELQDLPKATSGN